MSAGVARITERLLTRTSLIQRGLIELRALEEKIVAEVLVLTLATLLHGCARVLVEASSDSVDIVIAPFDLLPQGEEFFLNTTIDGTDIEFRVLEKLQQQFEVAIARPATDPVDGRVEPSTP